MAPVPRLLVTLPPADETRAAIAHRLPGTPFGFPSESRDRTWPEAEAMLVGALDRELPGYTYASTPKLRFVQRVYTGLDGFPFALFPDGVEVAGNVGGFAPFVAEHAVALLLAAAKGVVPLDAQARDGRLRPAGPTRSLVGRRALLLGYGAIARALSLRLSALGMEVEGVARRGGRTEGTVPIRSIEELPSLLPTADVIVNCLPLTAATRGLLNAPLLARARPDAILVNVGRAGTIEEGALYDHLRGHPRFLAALDVFWEEDFGSGRIGFRHPFASLPNVVLSPHVAGHSEGARAHALDTALENLQRFFRGERPLHLADRREYP